VSTNSHNILSSRLIALNKIGIASVDFWLNQIKSDHISKNVNHPFPSPDTLLTSLIKADVCWKAFLFDSCAFY